MKRQIYCGDFLFKQNSQTLCEVKGQVYVGETAGEAMSDRYTLSKIKSRMSSNEKRKVKAAQNRRNLVVEIINRIHLGFTNK